MNQDVSHDSTQADEQSPYLPSGWYWSTVGELAADTLIGLDRGRQHQSSTPPGFAYVKMNNVTTDGRVTLEDIVYVTATEAEARRYSLRTGDVLFNTRNSIELVGKVGLVQSPPPNTVFNNNLMRIRFRDGIHGRFVCYQMCSPDFRDRMAYAKRATTNVAAVYAKNLFPLPVAVAPHAEQGRIVAKIEELFSDLDAGIVALERVRANLKRYRAAVLKAAVEGKLTEDWRAQHPDTEPASVLLERILTERRRQWEQAELAKFAQAGKQPPRGWQEKYPEPSISDASTPPSLPVGWCRATVDQVISFLRNGLPQKPTGTSSGHRILRINAVRPLKVDLNEVRFFHQLPREAPAYLIEDGDLLFTRYNGSVELLGVAGMVRGTSEPTLHPDKLIRVKTILGAPLTNFLEIATNVGVSRQHMINRARTTAGQTGISGTDIREMPLPLPPLEEQREIVQEVEHRLSIVDEVQAQVDTSLKRAGRLRQGILKRAFEGRLVLLDPSDESVKDSLAGLPVSKKREEASWSDSPFEQG